MKTTIELSEPARGTLRRIDDLHDQLARLGAHWGTSLPGLSLVPGTPVGRAFATLRRELYAESARILYAEGALPLKPEMDDALQAMSDLPSAIPDCTHPEPAAWLEADAVIAERAQVLREPYEANVLFAEGLAARLRESGFMADVVSHNAVMDANNAKEISIPAGVEVLVKHSPSSAHYTHIAFANGHTPVLHPAPCLGRGAVGATFLTLPDEHGALVRMLKDECLACRERL
jgi:hypothetical protein